jgi:predicted nucleotidyltransferase
MLTDTEIHAAVARLAAALKPKKIILFGSYARGDATERSDLDLMVVGPSIADEAEAMRRGRRAIGPTGTGVDVLVYDEDTFSARADWCSSPVHWAITEGKVLYESAP